ncbi:MAG TPA: alpha/beta fold hydrolase [Stellaceae bacterium]|nr:alpha/beta fold hydrolase [Stellaceae bacterium]
MTPGLRQGPRPLGLHLTSAMGAWLSSRAASPLLKSGSRLWRPEFAVQGAALSLALNAALARNDGAPGAAVPYDLLRDPFLEALDRELIARAAAFLDGIERYRQHPYARALEDPPVVWREGTTRLVDYGPPDGAPLLVVPSLINRAYILDLAPGQSLLRYLSSQGLRPMLVDWDAPADEERRFGLGDYIAQRLEPALEAAREQAGAEPIVMGYCMGGLLALALAARRPHAVKALALLATPWRFHAERAAHARLLGVLAEPIARSFEALGEVPVDVLQALFFAQDALIALRKFTRFAELAPDSAAARGFVALEDWLNDGVPLAVKVARECLGGWYGEDLTGRGRWRVAGTRVLPAAVQVPSLVIVPGNDRIVPPKTAEALAEELPDAERMTPPLGHIGMITAREAPSAVWAPLAAWLKAQAA